jgi:hypothetical protein
LRTRAGIDRRDKAAALPPLKAFSSGEGLPLNAQLLASFARQDGKRKSEPSATISTPEW